jgi:AraC-like DNA-binding protein
VDRVVDCRAGKVVSGMATMDARSDSLAAGEAALGRGDWGEARAKFEQALAGGAGPEALEGLATAAWFLDFADQSHLTRVLRAETGRTPSALRALLASG